MSRADEPLSDLLDFAVDLAWRAGRATLPHFQTGADVETKPDATPVTAADRGAERLARSIIGERFPEDGILGEEFGAERPGAARRWVLDPIDGTKSFVQGVPLYGVLVALEQDGEPVLGVLHFPALDETVCAARGLGCRWNGRPARVSSVDRLEDAVVVATDIENMDRHGRREGWDRLRDAVRLTRTWGDAYGYALVATGRAEAMLDPVVSHWDVAPLRPIIEEAGGEFTDWDGRTTSKVDHAVAANGALAARVRELIAGSDAAGESP